MKITYGHERKAISPVIATVILIAITLIAAIAIAGFVFGLFGSFTSSAQVSASSVQVLAACTGASPPAGGCKVSVTNTGTANTNALSGSITYGGITYALTITASPVAVNAGAGVVSLPIVITTPAVASPGTQFVGSISCSNGAQVPFSGTFG